MLSMSFDSQVSKTLWPIPSATNRNWSIASAEFADSLMRWKNFSNRSRLFQKLSHVMVACRGALNSLIAHVLEGHIRFTW